MSASGSPCEVGYGRGFGAGIGQQGQVLVLGPSQGGHRMVRMAAADGELLEAADIEPFEDAVVRPDVVVCANARMVWGSTRSTSRNAGDTSVRASGTTGSPATRAASTVSNLETGKYGVARLDADTGQFDGYIVAPSLPVIRDLDCTGNTVALVTADLTMLEDSDRMEFITQLAQHPDEGPRDTLSLVALYDGSPGEGPLWFRILETGRWTICPTSRSPGTAGSSTSSVARCLRPWTPSRAALWATDGPGLDEKIAWTVVDGAGLLAEETRVSVFGSLPDRDREPGADRSGDLGGAWKAAGRGGG